MNLSHTLKKFLHTGSRPADQRTQSALLDEARSHLVSKLPTTAETIQTFSDAEIEAITAGGKPGAMARAHAIYNEKQGRFVKTGKPLAKPTAKAPAPAPGATSKPATIHRSTAAAKPTTPAPSALSPKLITAAEFSQKQDTAPRMFKSEFNKLDHSDRNSFIREGGKLIADPKPSKK